MTLQGVVFDLFGTLVPEFRRSDFYDAVRRMAEILGADPVRFEVAWNATALERQTGGFATVADNVRSICASLGVDPSGDAAMWRASPLAPFIDVEVFSSEVGLRKPDAAIYRYAADGLGVDTQDCLYCGDGAHGELSGAAAVGMTPYLMADPSVDPKESLTPERENWDGPEVSDLRDLLPLVLSRI